MPSDALPCGVATDCTHYKCSTGVCTPVALVGAYCNTGDPCTFNEQCVLAFDGTGYCRGDALCTGYCAACNNGTCYVDNCCTDPCCSNPDGDCCLYGEGC